jgi:hypothetical protein
MNRFVIHKHTQGNEVHWDLMIEAGDILKTWRLENPPEKLATQKTRATPIFDHDKKFLTYQGSVNNDKGSVEIVDSGEYKLISENDCCMELIFNGKNLKGSFRLSGTAENWRLEMIETLKS